MVKWIIMIMYAECNGTKSWPGLVHPAHVFESRVPCIELLDATVSMCMLSMLFESTFSAEMNYPVICT